ncbi:uncharacterized protein SAMN05661008_01187 [Alkalithermobacter thermoalcaliphilus JW-YL-7 = DSM 7308]|uniref:DUF177 domain-containing protein n=1 Tax=Alkalithermobacter thermoalcaliphilus JW-YL-7 = DSM 7308 TaxID=1121328 RepID=A0A150FRF3_CLOPD|nr:protein of unknown function DUF177 [[Clostridium] paradoxum JW-YL-7 = DSM 7308]SHK95580.1 uncharacterized protein SAMN05661008_01187 [[Clostridium] paradoxum JW-YL-7 = DSM 7308]
MKISLEKLLKKEVDTLDLHFCDEIDTINYQGRNFKFTSPVKVDGKIFRAHEGLYLDCNIEFSTIDLCSRCLKEVETSILSHVKGFLVTSEEEIFEEEDTFVYNGDELDFTEIIENAFILNIPSKILCKENCKGICDKCGVNLNEAQCECFKKEENEEFIDPRLSKLKDFFKNS